MSVATQEKPAAPPEKPNAPEDLLALSKDQRYELLDGQLIELPDLGADGSLVVATVLTLLRQFSYEKKLGAVLGSECAYQIFGANANRVRRPDGAFVRRGRLPDDRAPRGVVRIVPDLVVEVVSPKDSAEDVDQRVTDFLGAGVPLVWVVFPRTKQVHVFHGGRNALRLAATEELTGEEILPGFSCPVGVLFQGVTLPAGGPLLMQHYVLEDESAVFSPALLFYKDLIRHNLGHALAIAGGPERLRPHIKTHKTREIVKIELAAGITKHKCATIAEAEMLAGCGAPDILIAYPLIGPNCTRLAKLAKSYPDCRFLVTVDSLAAAEELSKAVHGAGQTVEVLLDIDTGQHRTGVPAGPEATALYEQCARLPGLKLGGLHVYDGHQQHENPAERHAAVQKQLEPILGLRSTLERKDLPVPRMVMGGTPTFPIYGRLQMPGLECAPGTCFLHDHGYGSRFPDLAGFTPAALLLTRVISRPAAKRLTLDLGYKAVASDPPAGKRCVLLDVPDVKPILHNEEHYVVETPAADKYPPGSVIYAIPTHICPTVAMHKQAYVVEQGRVTEMWDIVGRDRVLTI
jgi:D-threonine aldolase